LITSRFPLPDLAGWTDCGFKPVDLRDLDPPAARAVLRRWGVKGDDATLHALARRVHNHALTVAVLGSYLGTFHEGDPTKAPPFDRAVPPDADPKAAKLHRVLSFYARELSGRERDLLSRVSVFPRGVSLSTLNVLVN